MRKEILQGALTLEQRKAGFTFEEDDHCLYLLHKGKRVAVFSAIGVTIKAIRDTANELITKGGEQ